MRKYMMIGIIFIISIFIFLLLDIFILPDNRPNYYPNDNINSSFEISFENAKKGFQSGDLTVYANIVNIPKEYYIRPEFYSFYDNYKSIIFQNGTYGYGAQPSEVSYSIKEFKTGQHVDTYTFVFSSYNVVNYQGIMLNLISPDNKLFEIHVDPSEILLYPILIGDPINQSDWVYRIQMRVVAKKDVPKGIYTFKLDVEMPSDEKQEEFYNITQNLKGKYVNAGIIKPSKFFDFILNVG